MRFVIPLLVLVAMVLTGCATCRLYDSTYYSPNKMEDLGGVPHLSGIGDVLFAGQPTEEGLSLLAQRGVKVIVNLRPDAEMQRAVNFDEAALVESLGMEYVHIPMTPSTFSAADVEQFEAVFDRRGSVWGEPLTMVVHCRSSNRCGGLWAAFVHEKYRFKESKAIEYGKLAGLRSESMIEAAKRVMDE